MTFAQIFAPICRLDESTLVAESQSRTADFGLSASVDRFHRKMHRDIRHRLWFLFYFFSFSFRLWFHRIGRYQTCLMFWDDFRTLIVFICHTSLNDEVHVSAQVCFQNDLKSCSVWPSVMYYAQLFFVTIYKIGKCMMPIKLISKVMYFSLKWDRK